MARRTTEQREDAEIMHAQVHEAGLRVRVVADAEGFPVIPGRLGRVEHMGVEPNGARRLRAYTSRRLIPARLRALPGLHPEQIGDAEARFWFPADDPDMLRALCAVLDGCPGPPGAAPPLLSLACAHDDLSAPGRAPGPRCPTPACRAQRLPCERFSAQSAVRPWGHEHAGNASHNGRAQPGVERSPGVSASGRARRARSRT